MTRISLIVALLFSCASTPKDTYCPPTVLELDPSGPDYPISYLQNVIEINKRACRVRRFLCLEKVQEIGENSFRSTCTEPMER